MTITVPGEFRKTAMDAEVDRELAKLSGNHKKVDCPRCKGYGQIQVQTGPMHYKMKKCTDCQGSGRLDDR